MNRSVGYCPSVRHLIYAAGSFIWDFNWGPICLMSMSSGCKRIAYWKRQRASNQMGHIIYTGISWSLPPINKKQISQWNPYNQKFLITVNNKGENNRRLLFQKGLSQIFEKKNQILVILIRRMVLYIKVIWNFNWVNYTVPVFLKKIELFFIRE